MVDITGGCDRCHMLCNNTLESYEKYSKLYCNKCQYHLYVIIE